MIHTAFKDIDQLLIDECIKDILDLDKIKTLIADGADINAFDTEYEQELYDSILDYYIDHKEDQLNLSNLLQVTQLFIENNLSLNQKPEDCDYFLLRRFRFLPPNKICVDIFIMLLERGTFTSEDLDNMIDDCTLDLHLGEFYFYELTQYSKEDSIKYYLELIYWSCAYNVKTYPEKCSEDVLQFNWFEREKNRIEIISENRSTSVFVEDLETHQRAEIQGWTMKY